MNWKCWKYWLKTFWNITKDFTKNMFWVSKRTIQSPTKSCFSHLSIRTKEFWLLSWKDRSSRKIWSAEPFRNLTEHILMFCLRVTKRNKLLKKLGREFLITNLCSRKIRNIPFSPKSQYSGTLICLVTTLRISHLIRCQFHQHFMCGFFGAKVSPAAFWTYILSLYSFGKKNISAKALLKMLAKLTKGWRDFDLERVQMEWPSIALFSHFRQISNRPRLVLLL